MFQLFALPVLIILAVSFIVTSIRIADQYARYVILRFGAFVDVRGPGLFLLLPFGIERGIRVDIRATTWTLPPQDAITKDNVPVKITAVLWNQITDPEKSVLEVDDVENAVRQLAATTIRVIIGQHELDDVLCGAETIAKAIADKVETLATEWGVQIMRVEIADVQIPESMQRAIAQKAEAAREQAARLIKAEGELKAAEKLSQAAAIISKTPEALELRRMQMLTEIGAEQNTSTIVIMPSEFAAAAGALARSLGSTFARNPD